MTKKDPNIFNIIRETLKGISPTLDVTEALNDLDKLEQEHLAEQKYKNLVFEKFKEFHIWFIGYAESDDPYDIQTCYNKAKELGLFTIGLDVAIAKYDSINVSVTHDSFVISEYLQEIKQNLND